MEQQLETELQSSTLISDLAKALLACQAKPQIRAPKKNLLPRSMDAALPGFYALVIKCTWLCGFRAHVLQLTRTYTIWAYFWNTCRTSCGVEKLYITSSISSWWCFQGLSQLCGDTGGDNEIMQFVRKPFLRTSRHDCYLCHIYDIEKKTEGVQGEDWKTVGVCIQTPVATM